jgi:anti-sigma regulatory factor (Ser/Thr protein kinase)
MERSQSRSTRKLTLPPRPEAVPAARAAVGELIGDFGRDAAFRAQIAVSEVVANCVRHVGFAPDEEIAVHLTRSQDRFRAEIVAPGAGIDPLRLVPAELSATSGRGLLIVDAVVDRWGTVPERPGTVWFEIHGPPTRSRGDAAGDAPHD